MLLFAICIIFNVLLGVIFKLFPKYGINNLQAITTNYLISFILGSIILGKIAIPDQFYQEPWFPFAVFLALTFIIGFNITAYTFQIFGITFTTIVQKMSLVIPVSVAIVFFSESSSLLKYLGILCALASIVLINLNGKHEDLQIVKLIKKYWYFPLFSFVIGGLIETTLLYMEKKSISEDNDLEFVTMLFGIAGVFGIISSFTNYFRSKVLNFQFKNIAAGIVLGVPNFFTIYLLVLLLKNWQGSIVFPVNNVGILAVSAVVAIIFFKEPFSRNRQLGLALAILSIFLISQF